MWMVRPFCVFVWSCGLFVLMWLLGKMQMVIVRSCDLYIGLLSKSQRVMVAT